MTCRFPNEGGFLGPAALPTVLASLGGQGIGSLLGSTGENVRSAIGGDRCAPDAALEQWLGRSIKEMSIEDYAGRPCRARRSREYIAELPPTEIR